MSYADGSRHHLVLYTAGKQALLTDKLRPMVEQSFKTLPRRFPGLRILEKAVHPDRVEMVLDLHRLDEDLARIVQSFKAEVKSLAKKEGFTQHSLWQWTHEEI